MTAFDIIDQVPEFAHLVAVELKRILEPHADGISANTAYRLYGRSWIETLTKKKVLCPIVKGNKKIYSTSEIERCLAKKNATARLIIKK